ncbi:MAG: sigma-70 family RNA polymerase sigma factor [Actinobacteria bacterium]|nr:sigma-70 family RNA polymerase sigma factor [Actinomycetota bacterium]
MNEMEGERRMVSRTDWAELTDEELAIRCSEHVAGCMDELVGRYEQRVRDCAQRMSLDRQDAEDAVQEIFLRMVSSLPRFQGKSAFATWMYRLSHNTCIDAFRKGTRDKEHRLTTVPKDEEGDPLDRVAAKFGDPEAELDATIQECYLGQALAGLPESYRDIVRLRLGEGRSNGEVAQLLGTTVDSVKSKLRRARKLLQERLLERRSCPICKQMGPFRLEASGVD